MPDTPVNIDGNSIAFEITLPKGSGKLQVASDGTRKLAVSPGGRPLQLRFTAGTGEGGETVPLGVNWTVIIEEVP
jgi:hypothetical protein